MCENPKDPLLWQLSVWRHMLQLPGVVFTDVDQCCYGLRRPDTGELLQKSTNMVASSPLLIRFLNRRCTRNRQHGDCFGHIKMPNGKWLATTKYAQAWPRPMCAAIVRGILLLLQLPDKFKVASPGAELKSSRGTSGRSELKSSRSRLPYSWGCACAPESDDDPLACASDSSIYVKK